MRQGLDVLRKQTREFIDENPTSIALTRSTRVSDNAGGFRTTTETLEPQAVRIIEQPATSVESRTVSGEVLKPDFVVIGEHDLDIREGDSWSRTINGQKQTFEVMYVRYERSYETWAEVKSNA